MKTSAASRRRVAAACVLSLPALLAACGGEPSTTQCGTALCARDASVVGDVSSADVAALDAPVADAPPAAADVAALDAPVASSPGVVVSVAWLADALAQGRAVQVVDVRSASAWRAGHIAGARVFDANTLSATVNGVSNEVLAREVVATRLGAAGLRADVTTVIYGETTTTAPARMVWTLHHYGQDDVHLLDGGFEAWRAAGHAADTAEGSASPATWSARDGRDLIDGPTVLARHTEAGVILIDVRTASEFAAGHIPNARNVDWTSLVDGAALRPDDALRGLLGDIPRDARVIVYCQSGVRAAVGWAVLRHLGHANTLLYDGSWAEWSARGYPQQR